MLLLLLIRILGPIHMIDGKYSLVYLVMMLQNDSHAHSSITRHTSFQLALQVYMYPRSFLTSSDDSVSKRSTQRHTADALDHSNEAMHLNQVNAHKTKQMESTTYPRGPNGSQITSHRNFDNLQKKYYYYSTGRVEKHLQIAKNYVFTDRSLNRLKYWFKV